jgi:hypothetical protein
MDKGIVMKINVWDMAPDDIAIIDGKKFRWRRDFKKRYPSFGTMATRELVNINNPSDKKLALRGFDVELLYPKK